MRNPKLAAIGLIVLAVLVVLTLVLPHPDGAQFWLALAFFLGGVAMAFLPSLLPAQGARDFTFALPAYVMLTGYLAGTFVVLLLSAVVSWKVVLVIDVVLAAAAAVVAVMTSIHRESDEKAGRHFVQHEDEQFVPREGSF